MSIVDQDGNFDLELLKACFREPRTFQDIKKVSTFHQTQLIHNQKYCGFQYLFSQLDEFKNLVVQPIHKQTDMNYFVEDVSSFETTESIMPGGNISYNQYYQEKYGFILIPPNQPLLSISNAGKKHFMFRNERQGVSSTSRLSFFKIQSLLIILYALHQQSAK
jgi:hypothetical protein